MRNELREQREQHSVQHNALNVLREDVVQQQAVLSSLSDGQANVLETLAVLMPIREESQQLREVAQQLCERVGVLEGQVSTVHGVVASVRQADERFNDFCEGTAFIVTECVGERLTLLEDTVQGLESRLSIKQDEFLHDTVRDCMVAITDRSSGGLGTVSVDADQAGSLVLDVEDVQRVKDLPRFTREQVLSDHTWLNV
jgi:hypothetical protein